MVTGFYPTETLGQGELDKGQPQPFKTAEDAKRYVVGFHVITAIATYYAQLADIKYIASALTQEQFTFTSGLGSFSDTWQLSIQPLNPHKPFQLDAPFRNTTKGQVVELGADLGVPFEDTWSCHDGGPLHCGKCSGCVSRKEAFSAVAILDPTKYQS